MSSNVLFLYSHTQFPNSKLLKLNHTHHLPFNSQFLDLPHKHHSRSLPFHLVKTFTSPTNFPPFRNLSHLKISNLTCSIQPQNKFSKIVTENLLGFLIGSFIFLGCFNLRPAMALTAHNSGFSESLEEKRDTQKRESEDEEMNEKILEREPRNVEALKVVVYGKLRKGKTKDAVKFVEKLIDVEPEEVEWKLLLALCYEMMGQLSKAKRSFKDILKERPLLVRALHGLALVMHKKHEGPAVFEMLNKALNLARHEKRVTEERNIRILIAQMHVVKGELEEALKKFQDLVSENPRDFRPYLCQGIIYSLLDKKEEAVEQFETYRALVPDEFPQRGFLDDVMLSAKTKSQARFRDEFDAEFSHTGRKG